MNIFRKTFIVLLSLMMVFTTLPASAISAFAADEEVNDQVSEEQETENITQEDQTDPADTEELSDTEEKVSEEETGTVENDSNEEEATNEEALDSNVSEEPEETKDDLEVSDSSKSSDGDSKESTEEASSEEDVDEVSYINSKKGPDALLLQGDASKSQEKAIEGLMEEGLTKKEAKTLTDPLFAASNAKSGNRGTEVDDLVIENVEAVWFMTPAVQGIAVDNGDDNLLLLKPKDDGKQILTVQVNYSLSSGHPHEPGDIQIKIPAYFIHDRNGQHIGKTVIPYAEDPSTKDEYNWKREGDYYILTNTKTIRAGATGFVQFDITKIYPHAMIDMEKVEDLEPFKAEISVKSWKGNVASDKTNELFVHFDTEAKISKVTKKIYGTPEIVELDNVPAGMESSNGKYVKATWYITVNAKANTYYKLDYVDTIPEEETNADGETYRGFIIGATDEDGKILEKNNVYTGYKSDQLTTYTVITAYPLDQFESEHDYTFNNNVEFTLTEIDPEAPDDMGGTDPVKVTTASASANTTWNYAEPEHLSPNGHFGIVKNGNDDKAGNNYSHHSTQAPNGTSDTHMHSKGRQGWYGVYGAALNDLLDQYEENGEDGYIRLSYTLNPIGYSMPWMFDDDSYETDGAQAPWNISNYSNKVEMTTNDYGISIGRKGAKLKVFDDFNYISVEFPADPYVYQGKPNKINEDGSWHATDPFDGTFLYTKDDNRDNWPDIELQILRNGNWEHWATASWKSGSFEATLVDGSTQSERVIDLPEDAENFRTVVTMENNATKAKVNQAALDYDIRVVVGLKSTESLIDRINSLFEDSNGPKLYIYNRSNLTVRYAGTTGDTGFITSSGTENYSEDGTENKDGYDIITGYRTDTMIYPSKSASYDEDKDYDGNSRTATIHYSAKVEERSFINSKKSYMEALEEGKIEAETSCVWRDLLPEGVVPDLGTIRLRDGDTVKRAYKISNYNNSGRDLLVVEAELTPTPQQYKVDGVTYYMDVPSISFDGKLKLNSALNSSFNKTLHNVISFQSSNAVLGTVDGYAGEPDDPYSNNNVATSSAFANNKERDAMKDLDRNCTTPSFVYAGANVRVHVPVAGITGLGKRVMVNNDGEWSLGVYESENDYEADIRTVYTGGVYSYRISYRPQANGTKAKGIILYDSLEDYVPSAENSDPEIDVQKPRWQGTLKKVDVSQLEEMGCAPVVYYSTQNIDLEEGYDGTTDPITLGNMDLTNRSIWTPADEFTGDLSTVKSIAIDASKGPNNEDFELAQDSSHDDFIEAIVYMNAPKGEDAAGYIEENAHAYNKAHAIATTVSGGIENRPQHVECEYTKVGLMNYDVTVKKVWDDDNDRDKLRTDSVTLRLMANNEPTDIVVTLPVTGENGEKVWEYTFENIDYCDEEGEPYVYSLTEEPVPTGYSDGVKIDGNTFTMVNTHIPEKVSVSGIKTWRNDTESMRPEYIVVKLYADGLYVQQKKVYPNSDGAYAYTFNDLFKYNRDGNKIKYTVKEEVTGILASYSQEYDGYDIINTYHPYGDLKVKKEVKNTTPQSENTKFSFGFEFYETTTNEGGETVREPIPDRFEYAILDAEGNEIEDLGGTVATGETIEIIGGQTIHVKEIDEYVEYKVYEEDGVDGFEPVGETENEGTIKPNATQNVNFVNKYSTDGSIEFKATKTLYGHELQKYKFHYGIYELTRDEDGNITNSTLIRTGSSGEPDETITNDDGQTVSATAPVGIGKINYAQEDNGKAFYYKIVEFKGRNEMEDAAATSNVIDGYVYDETVYYATVTVTDNGDGTMDTAVVYTDEDGTPLEGGDDPDFVPLFENRYQAVGSTEFKVWKDLQGRRVRDEEFEFELLDSEGYTLTLDDAGKAVRLTDPETQEPIRAKNDDTGTAAFEEIRFDQTDIGKTYYFAFKEVIPEEPDTTVTYDTNVYGYKVTITDNNDGTLSCSVLKATPLDEGGTQAKQNENGKVSIASWTEEDAGLPVFENKLKPGGFSVTKLIDNPDEAPNEKFHFIVKLIGDDIPDTLEYDLTQVGQGEPAEPDPGDDSDEPQPGRKEAATDDNAESGDRLAEEKTVYTEDAYDEAEEEEIVAEKSADNETPAENSEPGVVSNTINGGNILTSILDKLASLFADKAYAEGEVNPNEGRSTEGTAYAVLTGEGDLILFRSYDTYTHNSEGTFTDIFDNTYSGRVFTEIETTSLAGNNNCRWYSYRTKIKTVRVADDQLIKPIDCAVWFEGCSNMTNCNPDGLDTSIATSMNLMFCNCSRLTTLDLSGFRTPNVTKMNSMFNGCSSLASLDVTSFDTSKVTTMNSMFCNCSSLTSLDVTNFDTSKVTSMCDPAGFTTIRGMFSNCSSLTSLDLSNFNTSKVMHMRYMFYNCSSLTSLDLSNFNTAKVKDMGWMFRGCSSLTSLNLSSFITPNVTDMASMFESCTNLGTLDLSSFYKNNQDTSALTDCSNMFKGCSKLSSIDFKYFNTKKVTNMGGMFDTCTDLVSVDLSPFDTTKVTTMRSMFSRCKNLANVTFDNDNIDTSSVRDFYGMFLGCSKLEALDLSGFKTTSATYMVKMFQDCNSLESLDIKNFAPRSASDMFVRCNALKRVVLGESFRFTDMNGGTLLPQPPTNTSYTGKWIMDTEAYGPYTPLEVAKAFNGTSDPVISTALLAGTWIWEKKSSQYTINFAAPEEATGSMPRVKAESAEPFEIPENQFYWFKHTFRHWTDGRSRTIYEDKGTIPANKYAGNDRITLTAVFDEMNTRVSLENGQFDLYLYGNEKATFDNIPAGTAYQIWEETPEGWVLVKQENVSGTIEPLTEAEAKFTNRYQPGVATAQFYGTKTLDNLAAEEGAFSFTLSEEGNETGTITIINEEGTEETVNLPYTVSTLEGGFIRFPQIKYSTEDVGTHTYTIKEVDPNDDTLDYDTHKETVTVVVSKDDDGVLSSKITYDDDGIRFKNKTRPGVLRVTKDGGDVSDIHNDEEFTFKITLQNENGQPLGEDDTIYWYKEDAEGNIITGSKGFFAEAGEKAASAWGGVKEWASETWEDVKGVFTEPLVEDAYGADDDIASGTYDGVDWRITAEGVLEIGKTGTTQTFDNNTNRTAYSWPWYQKRSKVQKVEFVGTVNGQGSFYGMFYQCTKLNTINLARLNTYSVTNMSHMFYVCSALTSINFNGSNYFDTSNVTDMSYMFYQCTSLQNIMFSNHFNTSKVTDMSYMFYQCAALNSPTFPSSFNTSSVANMTHMFDGCGNSLTRLNLSQFDTSSVTDMSYMFYKCYNLSSITFSSLFNTSKVTDMRYMFSNCSKLSGLNLSSFDTSLVENMSYMFSECSNLSGLLDLSSFVATNVTNTEYMFWKCSKLTEIRFSNFKTSKVQRMGGMFASCTKLKNVNVSSFDTSSVSSIQMENIFSNCSSLEILDLSSFSTSNLTSLKNVFRGCSSLKELDISNFDTSHISSMQDMFNNCNKLQKVKLGENFSFNGNGIPYTQSKALLPQPPTTSPYTGMWIREDGAYGPYSNYKLQNSYTSIMAGTWVWAIDQSKGIVKFDANGGYTSAEAVTVTPSNQNVTMPGPDTTKYPHYALTGWNTEKDGSGTAYAAGETYDNVVAMGVMITLYAQWEETNLREYKVYHYQQNTNLNNYFLAETETFMADYGTTVTPEVKSYEGFISPEPKSGVVNDYDNMHIDYYYDRMTYKVYFDGNGATSGRMDPVDMIGGISQKLPKNTYFKTGSIFTGWSDTRRTIYTDGQTVVNLSKDGSDVTLYAQWLDNPNEPLEPTNGEIIVKCKIGETIVIPDLPAGTTYTIEEIDAPAWWTQSGAIGDTGTIQANETSYATIINKYSAEGEASIVARKLLFRAELEDQQFQFQLYRKIVEEDGSETEEILQTVSNTSIDGSKDYSYIIFDPIHFTEADIGTNYFYIRELESDDPSMDSYPNSDKRVAVTVSDAGEGRLETSVKFEGSSEYFLNYAKYAGLEITKEVIDGSPEDASFEILVELFDVNGNAVSQTVGPYFRYEAGSDGSNSTYGGMVYPGTPITIHANETIKIVQIEPRWTYKITELDKPGWTLVESENVEGEMEPGETAHATFTNEFTTETSLTLEADKTLTGLELKEGMFTFGVYDEDENLVTTGKNDANGHIEFLPIHYGLYDSGKTYHYTVSEIEGNNNGITYDDTEYDVTVNITPDEDGFITATASESAKNMKFENSYDASGEITFEGTKTLEGRAIDAADNFTFEIREGNDHDPIETATCDETGEIKYPTIHYGLADRDKTFTYTITEKAGTNDGITYSDKEYTVIVKVTDNEDGTLKVEKVGESDDYEALDFANTYDAKGSLTLKGTKTITGREMTENDIFTFEVTDENGDVKRCTNDADGNINYPTYEYTLADVGKTFTYTVREVAEEIDGITYDDTVYTVTVKIVDNKDGTLKAEMVDGSDDFNALNFVNPYKANGEITFAGSKHMKGRKLGEKESYEFAIFDENGEKISTAKSGLNGAITFETLKYTEGDVGYHVYSVKETSESGNGVTVDTTEYTITVNVKDLGDGNLEVTAKTDKEGIDCQHLVFTNTYEAEGELELSGTKTIEGRDMTDDDIFEFTVSEDGEVIQTAENDEDGVIGFENIEYTLDDVGTHTYTVKETAGDEENMTYDDTEYTVEVKVSDNGDGTLSIEIAKGSDDPEELDFVNEYKPEKPIDPDPDPETGDTTNIVPYACGFGAGLIALIIVLFRRKKKDK